MRQGCMFRLQLVVGLQGYPKARGKLPFRWMLTISYWKKNSLWTRHLPGPEYAACAFACLFWSISNSENGRELDLRQDTHILVRRRLVFVCNSIAMFFRTFLVAISLHSSVCGMTDFSKLKRRSRIIILLDIGFIFLCVPAHCVCGSTSQTDVRGLGRNECSEQTCSADPMCCWNDGRLFFWTIWNSAWRTRNFKKR